MRSARAFSTFLSIFILTVLFAGTAPLGAQTEQREWQRQIEPIPEGDEVPLKNWLVPSPVATVSAKATISPMALPSGASHFIAITPCRVVDTRNPDGPFLGPSFAPGQTRTFNIPTGPCAGIPVAAAYSLNFTIVNYDASNGFLTAFPSGAARPFVSTVNFGNGTNAVANAAVVPASAAGSIDVFSSGATHLIIDINGYFAEGVVTSFNGLSGAVSLAAGTDLTLTPSGQTVTMAVSSTSANTANTLVRRDGSGGFSAGTVALSGNLTLPTSSSFTAGNLLQGGSRLLHTFGSNNVFLGLNAGNFTMTGLNNTAIGFQALSSNTTGFSNTASGASALVSNTTGFNNTASGNGALFSNTTGSNNTASGVNALVRNIGDSNTVSGASALFSNTTGNLNTASGAFALFSNTTGSNNIAVGSSAGQSLTTGSGNIDIGNFGVAEESATIRIGSGQTRAFLAGVRGVTTGVADGLMVLIDSAGQLGTVSSSAKVKRDITGMGEQSSDLMKLRPVSFFYRNDAVGIRQYGLIAEEVAEVMPELVQFSPAGEAETVRYHFLAPLLLNEIQKQQQTIEEQRETIERQRETNELQRKQITIIEARLTTHQRIEELLEARLAALETQSRDSKAEDNREMTARVTE